MEYAGEASNDYQKLMRQNSENVRNHIAASHSEQVKKISNYSEPPNFSKVIPLFNLSLT